MIKCTRCGCCCYVVTKTRTIKCRYLIDHGVTSSCRIYNNRLGTLIYRDKETGIDHKCVEQKDIQSCPMLSNDM